jgi:transposase
MDVLTVDDYGAIRRARRDGMSIRRIAREFHHSRYKVRQVLQQVQPEPSPQTRNRKAPVLGSMHAVIDQILADDEQAPRKQRHTAAQIHRRLHDEHGYLGGYAQVQRYVRSHRHRHQETFIPLAHLPGHRLEADFGHIHVDFPEGRRLVPFIVAAWAYSNAPFVLALPFERTEAILEGMVAAFEFFGAVPSHVWWDNPKTVATLILQGRHREIHPHYKALASHYVFDPQFCMPGRGNEKPDAESTVKAVQRRFATPVPRVADFVELNARLRQRCIAEQDRVVQSLFGPFTIKDRFAEDLAAAAPLPKHRFDPCITVPAVVADKYQSVAFDRNRYSVPRPFAFQPVTVKGYVDRVVIVAQGRVIATHPRSLEKRKMILDPIHYLAALSRKPGALDHSAVFRDWKLPQCFHDFRAALEERHGPLPGARRFVEVLQLLAEHHLTRVRQAVEECARANLINAEAVIERTRTLAAIESSTRNPALPRAEPPGVASIQVPMPDLSRFDELLVESASRDDSRNKAMTIAPCDASVAGPVSVFCT